MLEGTERRRGGVGPLVRWGRERGFATVLYSLALVVSFAVPLVVPDNYILSNLVTVGIYSLLALSLGLLMGFTGQFSVAHAALFGLGAYTSALLVTKAGIPFWLTLPIVVVFVTSVGSLVSYSALRVRGIYLALVTLAFVELVKTVLDNWISLTGGSPGLSTRYVPEPIHLPGLPPIEFGSLPSYYYLVLVTLLIEMYIVRSIILSRTGRAFIAIREDEAVAQSVGIPIARYKVVSFAISSVFAGLAGAYWAPYASYIAPETFGAYTAIILFMALVLGGQRTFLGPIVGSAVYVAIGEFLRVAQSYRMVIYGVILILVVLFFPSGIVGEWQRLITTRKERKKDVLGRVAGVSEPLRGLKTDAET